MSFEARHPGRCNACGERIHVGDLITYSEDLVVHASCPEPVPERASRPVCGRCFMEIAASGACGCD